MKNPSDPTEGASVALELFQPNPDNLYTLEATAHLAGVPRRSLLLYCRAGLVRPILQPPYGVMVFTEEAIHAVRRMESLRSVHGLDIALLKTVFRLLDEVNRLRSEVRFLRAR